MTSKDYVTNKTLIWLVTILLGLVGSLTTYLIMYNASTEDVSRIVDQKISASNIALIDRINNNSNDHIAKVNKEFQSVTKSTTDLAIIVSAMVERVAILFEEREKNGG